MTTLEKEIQEAEKEYNEIKFILSHNSMKDAKKRDILEKRQDKLRRDVITAKRWLSICAC